MKKKEKFVNMNFLEFKKSSFYPSKKIETLIFVSVCKNFRISLKDYTLLRDYTIIPKKSYLYAMQSFLLVCTKPT